MERGLAHFSSGGVSSPWVNSVTGRLNGYLVPGSWGLCLEIFVVVVWSFLLVNDLVTPIAGCILLFPWSQQVLWLHPLPSDSCVGQRNLFGG